MSNRLLLLVLFMLICFLCASCSSDTDSNHDQIGLDGKWGPMWEGKIQDHDFFMDISGNTAVFVEDNKCGKIADRGMIARHMISKSDNLYTFTPIGDASRATTAILSKDAIIWDHQLYTGETDKPSWKFIRVGHFSNACPDD